MTQKREEIDTGGDGHDPSVPKQMPPQLKPLLKTGTFDDMLKSSIGENALSMLYSPGEGNDKDILNLCMRTDIPDTAYQLGICHYMNMCEKYGDKDGLKEAHMILATLPALNKDKFYANRTEQVIRAITGNVENERNKEHNFIEAFKRKAGLGRQ